MFIRFLIHFLYFLLVLFLFSVSENKCDSSAVRGRALFGNTYTSTVTKTNVVTSLIPSSCVQVEATLPPCRNVRYLKFPKLPTITFMHPSNQQVLNNWKSESEVETTAVGWGEYFGLYAPTVTVTATDLQISTVEDPSVVVTFAVKGCRPLKLPLDLQRCPQENLSTISIEETLQTSTVVSPTVLTESLLPTKTMPITNPSTVVNGKPVAANFQDNSNLLETSQQELPENGSLQPTDTLRV